MPETRPELKRVLGLWGASSIVVGTVIGSGIFLVPTAMIRHLGSPVAVLLVWVVGGALSLAGALTYAELPRSSPKPAASTSTCERPMAHSGFYLRVDPNVGRQERLHRHPGDGFFLLPGEFPPRPGTFWWRSSGCPSDRAAGPLEIRAGQLLAIGVIIGLAALNYYGHESRRQRAGGGHGGLRWA